jgi:hypothetical protein
VKIEENTPPRCFTVGHADHPIVLQDCAHISLESNQQITLLGPEGSELDVTRKSWGYYAMSSLNSRLLNFGLHTVLVRSLADNKFFILLVEDGKKAEFEAYLKETHQEIITWLDSDSVLSQLKTKMQNPAP